MKGKTMQLRRPLSFLLAMVMTLSNMGGAITALADEMETDVSSYMEETGQEEPVVLEEPPVYELILPYYEGCIYDYDLKHEIIPEYINVNDEKRDIFLNYQKDEEVKLMIFPAEFLEITELHLYDKDKKEPAFKWDYETRKLDFFMPETDLRLDMTLMEKVIEMPVEEVVQEEVPAIIPEDVYVPEEIADDQVDTQYEPVEDYTLSETEQGTDDVWSEEQVQEDPVYVEEAGVTETESYEVVIETDGLPSQGSIDQMEAVVIPFDTWDFDPATDFTNISYQLEKYDITYISDDIVYDQPGVYSSIYRVQQKNTERMWYVLRPVRVAMPDEFTITQTENENPTEDSTDSSEEDSESDSEEELQTEEMESEDQTEEGHAEDIPAAVIIEESTEATETETEAVTESADDETEESADETELDDTELESEQESEDETEDTGTFQVNIIKDDGYKVELNHEDGAYDAGEVVEFTTDIPGSCLIAAAALNVEANEHNSTEDILYSEISYDSAKDSFSFIMPEDDVDLSVIEDFIAESNIMLLSSGDEDEVPWDEATEIEANSYYYYSDGKTHPFSGGTMGSGGNDSYKYVRYKVDGKTYTSNAYCMQHSMTSPPSGTTYKKMIDLDEGGDDKYLRKALFYGYGGPGWNKTFNGHNIKSIMEDYGCPSGQMRAMQHYLVDYLYDGESGFGGALSTTAKNMLKAIKAALKEMPDPSAMELLPGLSTTANGLQTETFTWKANEAWVITIALEDGVSLVNETTGTTKTGKVQVKGGEKFHLVASQAKSGNLDGHYKITSNLPLNFHGMLLKLANSQDIGFGYYTDDLDISIVVDWPHSSTVTVEKHDANTGTITATSGYAMNGAVYGIYSDAGCSSLMERLTISNGRATSSTGTYVIGSTYYVKEITAPKGYALDTKVYPITVKSDAGANVAVSTDSPKKGKIRIIKKDAVTNTTSTVNSTYSMVGAEYTVYSNSGCTSAIETIRIGNDNMGVSAKTYLVGTYYVKETKAPNSNLYKLDTNVYPVSISLDQAAAEVTVDVTSTESPKRCKIKIEKHDTETGTTATVNSAYSMAGAEYTIYSDSSCKSAIETIRVGSDHTATSAKEYLAGTYYVKETKEPTCGLYKIDPTVYTISVTAEKVQAEQIIVATSSEVPKRSKIRIEKHDSDTGTTTPVSAAYSMVGAEYTIYSDAACTRALETLRIGSDNTATSAKDYFVGTYFIKETKEPASGLYKIDTNVHTVSVSAEKVQTEQIVVETSTETPKRSKLKVEKHDSVTGTTTPVNKNYSLKGAEYTIYSDSSCTQSLEKITIGDDNTATTVKEYLIGDYYIKETKAPLCGLYEMDDKVYTAHVTTDSVKGTAPVQIISTDPVKYGKISVQKINEKDGGKNPYTKALPFKDAVFGIYSATSCSEDVLLQTITTDENGYAESTDLLVDDYWVKEITPAVGYNINTDIIKVNASEMAAEIVHADSNCNYEVLEMVIRGDASLMKYLADGSEDEQRHYMDMVNSGELAGITFTFHYTAADDVEDVVITTDASGMCGTSGGALIYGEWEIIESNTPEGYEGLKEGTTIFIQNQNEKLNYVVYNGMITAQVRVLKKDAETGNMIPLSGAQFQLYDEKDNLISMYDTVTDTVTDVLTTNSNGIIYFTSKLSYGSYTLKEIYAPEGYTLAEPFTFKVDKNFSSTEPMEVTAEDVVQKGHIEITKFDERTGAKLGAGFKFEIRVGENDITDLLGTVRKVQIDGTEYELKAGTVLETVETDETGTARSSLLPLGSYVVKEVQAAEYYAVADKEYPVTLSFNREVQTILTDLPVQNKKTVFDLYKVNADQEEEVLFGITFRIFSSSDKDAEKARQIAEAVEALREEQQTEVAAANEEAAKELGLFIQQCDAELDELHESDPDSVEAKAEEHEAAILALMAEQKEAAKALADIHNEAVKTLEEKLAEELEITDFSVLGEEYVTDEDGHIHKEDLLHENTYYIYETKTLPGFNLDTTIHEFTVDENGLVDGKDYYEIHIANVPNHVEISKKSITGMEELPGAELEIRSVDEDGNETVIENWISTEEPHLISALPAGNYTLTEITAPIGYAIAKTIAFAVTDSLEIQQVEMIDELLEIYISKKDITNDEELPGASLTITDAEGTVVEEWESTDEPHMINLPAGVYVLTETAAPDGYLVASSITFTVDAEMAVQTVTMYDIPKADVYVSKKDVSTQEELPGAELSVTDEEGNEIDKWISEEIPHYLKLKPGKYVLTEIAAPEEYQYAESVEFEIGEEDYKVVQTVTMYDAPIPDVLISKKDISGGDELPGAELTVTDEEGNVIAQWFSTTEPHKLKLKPGTYTLTELQAPVDYMLAESITFTVRSDDYKAEQTVTMYDAKTPDVLISKKDITNEKELPGAELVIFRKNERPEEASTGDEIERWISTETPHAVKLLPGTYILREIVAPAKYATAEEIEFTVAEDGYKEVQTITMYDKPLTVSISKKDITNDEELPGAKLVVKDKDGKTVEEWISTKEPHEIVLEKGEYTLTEITAPQGYEVSETITFEVTDTMDVQHVTMYDSPKDELVDLTGKKKEETTTPGTPGTPGTDITTGPVKTGDFNRYLPAVILLSIGAFGALVLVITRKRKKK